MEVEPSTWYSSRPGITATLPGTDRAGYTYCFVPETIWYNNRLYCRLPSYKYSMVYNKDPIDKEKAIEKTYIHFQGLKKNWYQVMLLYHYNTSWQVTTHSTSNRQLLNNSVQAKYKNEIHYLWDIETLIPIYIQFWWEPGRAVHHTFHKRILWSH